MLSLELKNQIKELSSENSLEEIGGLIILTSKGYELFACKNISHYKQDTYVLNPIDYLNAEKLGKIVGQWHTQDSDEPSLVDNFCANQHNLYSIVYCKDNNKFYIIEPKLKDYLDKPFEIGKYDCLELLINYYKNELNIPINQYSREEGWFEKNPRIIWENFKNEGFQECREVYIKKHDVLLFGRDKENIFHIAVYLENNLMLHHPRGGKSSIEELHHLYKKDLVLVLRHKDLF